MSVYVALKMVTLTASLCYPLLQISLRALENYKTKNYNYEILIYSNLFIKLKLNLINEI